MDAYVSEKRIRAGRRVLILGDAAAYAKEQGTSVYEVLCCVLKKAEKIYVP